MKPEKNNSTQEGDSLIRITSKGDFNNTFRFLNKMSKFQINKILEKYGQMGVKALRSATPIDSGKTAECWGYEISVGKEGATIHWTNSNQNNGVYIAVILQYGHGTGTGGYGQGVDYINRAIRPAFDKIAEEAWMEVVNS